MARFSTLADSCFSFRLCFAAFSTPDGGLAQARAAQAPEYLFMRKLEESGFLAASGALLACHWEELCNLYEELFVRPGPLCFS